MSSPFTLTIDWLAFTLPSGSVKDTIEMLGGDWTKSETGFRGYPAFNLARREWEWCTDNPVCRVSMEKEHNSRDRWLTVEEEQRLSGVN
ncbi:MAG: hypothetical protein JW395_1367 [Nitrospira sp.]|nr:hypothetical protein [Nitrospira sp.]